MTQACALACRHCRATAIPGPNPQELTFEESVAFLRQIPKFGVPMPQLILTGGDPLARHDLFLLIEEAGRLGIGVSITPAATPALTHNVLARLKAHGIDGLGLSLDGSTASRHDSIRGVTGTFQRTLQAIKWAGDLKIPLQVNTLVSDETAGDIPLRTTETVRCHALEPLLSDFSRAREDAAATFARSGREPDGLGLRDVARLAVRSSDH
jgi:MoaA/NifB/PqqE/SkfB family radical SAM enzyme